jgi:hypothetical protein
VNANELAFAGAAEDARMLAAGTITASELSELRSTRMDRNKNVCRGRGQT